MKVIKKNKFTIFIVIFFIILFVLLLQVKNLFFPNSTKANYGDRLDGLVEVKKDALDSSIASIKENENVSDCTISTSGRIINAIITVSDSLSIKDAKTIGSSVKDTFEEEVIANYDIQVFMKKLSETETDFPIIGYKAKSNDSFSWTKERDKKTEEESE